MKRREFLKGAGVSAMLGGSLSGCDSTEQAGTKTVAPAASSPVTTQETIEWKMVTTWPKNFPGLGTGANYLAELIGQMSGGRLKVKVYGAKELVPAFEIFDAVSSGTAEMGHGAAYYWK